MAMRSAAFVVVLRSSARCIMDGARGSPSILPRHLSDGGKGRILGEEERAAETVYIKKMEKERQEKVKLKAEKEKAQKETANKKSEGNKP